jgi:hypothetical protein
MKGEIGGWRVAIAASGAELKVDLGSERLSFRNIRRRISVPSPLIVDDLLHKL